MKKQIGAIISLFLVMAGFPAVLSASGPFPVDAYFFHSDGCPHCHEEWLYLNSLKAQYPTLEIHDFEISKSSKNLALLKKTAEVLGVNVDGVPFLVIGDSYLVGYAGTASEGIKNVVEECAGQSCPDLVAVIVKEEEPLENEQTDLSEEEKKNLLSSGSIKIGVPFFGELDVASFSLPVITIIMGALDGFNPCAMWALLFLISLLLGIKDKKRMWAFGGAFIGASALVYFFLMAAWLNLILFLGFIIWIRLAVGGLALLGGGYSIREFFINKAAGCKITGEKKRRRFFEKLKEAVYRQNFWLALGGIIILAFAVNVVELVCSAGLPAVYAQILALNNVSALQRYIYLSLYVFVFMLDDLFVFFAAMKTMEMVGITTKYARFSRLIGGLILLAIGILLIFKPEWLMFG